MTGNPTKVRRLCGIIECLVLCLALAVTLPIVNCTACDGTGQGNLYSLMSFRECGRCKGAGEFTLAERFFGKGRGVDKK